MCQTEIEETFGEYDGGVKKEDGGMWIVRTLIGKQSIENMQKGLKEGLYFF